MDISIDYTTFIVTCFAAIFTIVLVFVVVWIINGVIRGAHRVRHGEEKVEAGILVLHPDTIKEYVPNTISSSNTFNVKSAYSQLFSDPLTPEVVNNLVDSGMFYPLFLQEVREYTSEEIASSIGPILLQKGLTQDKIKKSKAYVILSEKTKAPHMAYLVLVGNFPKSPTQLTVSFG